MITEISVSDIDVSESHRTVTEERVNDILIPSISLIGLLQPIGVRLRDSSGRHKLVFGAGRLEAARRMGWSTIPATIFQNNDYVARLAEIAENVHREDLTPLERAAQTAEWARLTAEPPESEATKMAKSRKTKGDKPAQVGQVSTKGGRGNRAGVADIARSLGIDRKKVQRALAIDGISDRAKRKIKALGLDNSQKALLEIAKEGTPLKQVAKAKEIHSGLTSKRKRKKPGEPQEIHPIILNSLKSPEEQEALAKLPPDVAEALIKESEHGGRYVSAVARLRRLTISGGLDPGPEISDRDQRIGRFRLAFQELDDVDKADQVTWCQEQIGATVTESQGGHHEPGSS